MRVDRSLGKLLLASLIIGMGLAGCGGDDSTTPPVPLEDWTNEGIAWTAPYSPDALAASTLEYRKSGTMVYLKGFGNASSTHVQAGQVIGTLPEGYRPAANISAVLLCPTWGWPTAVPDGFVGTAGVMIQADGEIQIRTVQQYDNQQRFIFFDGICFSTVVGGDGWTDEGFVWSDPFTTDGLYPSLLEFNKVGALVQLQGTINAGSTKVTAGQVIGTLPEGCRPPAGQEVRLLCPTWGWPTAFPDGFVGTAGLQILSDGSMVIKTVQQYPGEQQFLMLDGLSFSTVAGSEGWTGDAIDWNPPFSSEGTYPSTLELLQVGDIVRLRGFANAGTDRVQASQVLGTLAAGLRPPTGQTRFLLCPTWGWPTAYPQGYIGTAGVFIEPDGNVYVWTVQQFPDVQQFLMFDAKNFSTLP